MVFALVLGCNTRSEPKIWELSSLFCLYYIPFIGQMPANNSMYSKLVGTRHRGLYVSLLETSKTLARAIAGYLIGATYAAVGACVLWGITLGVWVAQMIPFLSNWSKLLVVVATESKHDVDENGS